MRRSGHALPGLGGLGPGKWGAVCSEVGRKNVRCNGPRPPRRQRVPDRNHSHAEERFRAIGRTVRGRYVFVVFTLRLRDGDVFIRPISARHMHQKEIEHYEKATQVQK